MNGTRHRWIREFGIVGPVAVLVAAGCGGGKSDRVKVEEGIRQVEHRHGAVVHGVSCRRYGRLADQHRWTCSVREDDPNGARVVTKPCEVTVADDASKFRAVGCGG